MFVDISESSLPLPPLTPTFLVFSHGKRTVFVVNGSVPCALRPWLAQAVLVESSAALSSALRMLLDTSLALLPA